MSFGHAILGLLLLAVLIFSFDLMLVHIAEWRQRVQREKAMRKWGFSPFDYGKEKKL